MMNVVHHRCDAFTIAFRTGLHKPLLEHLKDRARMAIEHGRVSVDADGKLIGVADGWELRYGRVSKRWNLIRQDHVRALVDLCAPGGIQVFEADPSDPPFHVRTRDTMIVPTPYAIERLEEIELVQTATVVEEPGWTLELVWYAQYLADRSLRSVIEESRDIAAGFGRVFEERVRRIDLAADVAGFKIRPNDRKKLVTRSALRLDPKRSSEVVLEEEDGCDATMHATRRAITGLTVGKGAIMCRMYDKQEELRVRIEDANGPQEVRRFSDKQTKELARWTAGGWNGKDPVSRVEFQIRGEALRELGVHTADDIVEPLVASGVVTAENGTIQVTERWKKKRPPRVTGAVYGLEDYFPRLWSSCIDWTRLITREKTKKGKEKQPTRCKLDPRWEILHNVKWNARVEWTDRLVIDRHRERKPVSSAQALGSMASLVAAREDLPLFDEKPEAYADNASAKLYSMLRVLCTWGIDQIAADLLTRWGSAEEAAAHLAIRLNAARSRFAIYRAQAPPRGGGKSDDKCKDSIKQCFSETWAEIPSFGSLPPGSRSSS
jgi:hypothetical protein